MVAPLVPSTGQACFFKSARTSRKSRPKTPQFWNVYLQSCDNKFLRRETSQNLFSSSEAWNEWIIMKYYSSTMPQHCNATRLCLNRWKQTLEHLIKIISRVFRLGFCCLLQHKANIMQKIAWKRWNYLFIFFKCFSFVCLRFPPRRILTIFIVPFRGINILISFLF